MLGSKTFAICLMQLTKPEGTRLRPTAPPLSPGDSVFLSVLSRGNITSVRKLNRRLLPNFQNKTTLPNF